MQRKSAGGSGFSLPNLVSSIRAKFHNEPKNSADLDGYAAQTVKTCEISNGVLDLVNGISAPNGSKAAETVLFEENLDFTDFEADETGSDKMAGEVVVVKVTLDSAFPHTEVSH